MADPTPIGGSNRPMNLATPPFSTKQILNDDPLPPKQPSKQATLTTRNSKHGKRTNSPSTFTDFHEREREEEAIKELMELRVKEDTLPLPFSVLKNGLSMLGTTPEGDTSVFLKLSLPYTGLHKLDSLKNFKYLQVLELPGNGISDVSILSNMRYLVRVDLSNNKLTDVLNIDPVPFNLQELDLSKNQIMQINDLSKHKYLQKLCLDRNLIKSIQGLSGCKYLTHLSLVNNGIAKIENLEGLPLKSLDLRRNRIKVIEGLETLNELEELRLGNNSIRTLSGLEHHTFLRILDLESNNIDDFDELNHLCHLPLLQDLTVRKNSIAAEVDYRLGVVFKLLRLGILDSMLVSTEEKVAAENKYNPAEEVVDSVDHASIVKRNAKEYAKIHASDLLASKRLRPVVLCGPSGVGKRTLTSRLLNEFPHLYGVSISHTTRKPRPGEENGTHYHFVTRSEMETMIEQGKFLEVCTLFGNLYGASFESIEKVIEEGKVCIMDLEIDGAVALKKSNFNPMFIFVTVPNGDVLHERLENRVKLQMLKKQPSSFSDGHVDEEMDNWVAKAPVMEQYANEKFFDYTLVNDDLEKAYQELKSFVLSQYWETYDDE